MLKSTRDALRGVLGLAEKRSTNPLNGITFQGMIILLIPVVNHQLFRFFFYHSQFLIYCFTGVIVWFR